jgi:hypothetical protein
MAISLSIETNEFTSTEVRQAMAFALQSEIEQAALRRDYFQQLCAAFEQRYGMASDMFLARFEDGELGDDLDWFDWYAAKRGHDLWSRRLRILRGVSL